MGTKVTKIQEQKYQKSRNNSFKKTRDKNPGTKVSKSGNKNAKIWEQKFQKTKN
jgi:hypothetical protein